MKKNLARAAIAALTLGYVGLAQAVPIYFEFTGSVSQPSSTVGVGTAVSGRINLETDRLRPTGRSDGIQYSFFDWEPQGLTGPLAYMDFAGTHFEVPDSASYYTAVDFLDGCQPLCNTGNAEDFIVSAYTMDAFSEGYTGPMHSRSFSLMNIYSVPGFPLQGYDVFEGATSTPLDIISLPLATLSGTYYESDSECVDGVCWENDNDYFVFRIDTLTRGIGPTTVPEPGTLGLLATSMLIGAAMRRRARSRSGPVC